MDRKIRTLKEIRAIANEQQFKFVRLCDLTGGAIVSYNPAHGKTAGAVEKKWQEIERRLKQCEPGIYIVQCRARFGGREKAYEYYVGHGNYDPRQLDVAPAGQQLAARNQEPVAEKNGKASRTENLLSVETALDYATENAKLTAENESLRRELADAKQEIASLEAELDDPERLADSGKNQLVEFFNSASPTLLPVADRVLGLFERKQNYLESKLLADNGYELPGFSKAKQQQRRQQATPKKDFNVNVPQPGDADWNDYVTWAGALDDDAFNEHLSRVEQSSQVVHTALCDALGVEFTDDDDNAAETN